MGYKELGKEISFADLAVLKSLEHNRSVKMMDRINKVVNWRNLEALLRECYEVGTSKEGADAYPALMLLKGLLLQKWFRIPSDPELENQIYPVEYKQRKSFADMKAVTTREMGDCTLFPIPRGE
jgi:hypothetical protein